MQTITVMGGNVFRIAAQYLGDATECIRILQLNNLIDYILPFGVLTTLTIPDPQTPTLGGIVQL